MTQRQAHALLLQRTGYQPRWVALVKHLRVSAWYDGNLAKRTTPRQRRRLGQLYRTECETEVASLLPAFPSRVAAIVDIGCGLAGPDLELARQLSDADFILVDQDHFEPRPFYGFKEDGAAYNSLSETVAFLSRNGVDKQRIRTVNVLKENFPDGPVDVVMSVISWGFHYPVDAYLRRAYDLLRPDGVAIIDVRSGTDGVDKLRATFGAHNVSEIESPHSGTPRYRAVKTEGVEVLAPDVPG